MRLSVFVMALSLVVGCCKAPQQKVPDVTAGKGPAPVELEGLSGFETADAVLKRGAASLCWGSRWNRYQFPHRRLRTHIE